MSLFNRRVFLSGLGLTALSGCGFEPIYGEDSAASRLQGQVSIDIVNGRNGFELRQHLEDRFGVTRNGRYNLSFDLKTSRKAQGITSTSTISRFSVDGTVTYKIVDMQTGKTVFTGEEKAFTSYSATSKTFPTSVAEQDANSRLASRLADLMITRLTATASDWMV